MKEFCTWCPSTLGEVPDSFNRKKHTAVCPKHIVTEFLFRHCYSDEEINRRTHYAELTKGR